MKLEDKVNEAITYHLLPFYNTEVIKAKFGQEVFKVIDEIASYATNDVLWSTNKTAGAHKEVMERLLVKYPFLTEASMIRIADVAAYFWKLD
jgi:hypothetical protein